MDILLIAVAAIVAIACFVVAFWDRIEVELEQVKLIVTAIGMVASFVIAYFAYEIDSRMERTSIREAQINRAVALARGILLDEKFIDLQVTAHQIEWKAAAARAASLSNPHWDSFKYHHAHQAAMAVAGNDQLRSMSMRLFQHASRARRCLEELSQQARSNEDSGSMRLCEDVSMLALLGEPLTEVYFALRPIILCDGNLISSKSPLEAIVDQYIERQLTASPSDANGYEEAKVDHLTEEYRREFCPLYNRAVNGYRTRPSELSGDDQEAQVGQGRDS